MALKYVYSIQKDFVSKIVDWHSLTLEVRNKIATISNRIHIEGDNVEICFVNELSQNEEVLLAKIISGHGVA